MKTVFFSVGDWILEAPKYEFKAYKFLNPRTSWIMVKRKETERGEGSRGKGGKEREILKGSFVF